MRYKQSVLTSVDQKPIKIAFRWILMLVLQFFIILIVPHITKFFVKQEIFIGYYEQFVSELIGFSLGMVILLGFLFDECIYFFKAKRYKVAIIYIVIIGCISGISCKMWQGSWAYSYYKDLHYVMEGTYLEDTESLKRIYEREVEGAKGVQYKVICVETTEFDFKVHRDIVEEENYNNFKAKFNNVKKVKIGYLPNSKHLLYIEPAEDKN